MEKFSFILFKLKGEKLKKDVFTFDSHSNHALAADEPFLLVIDSIFVQPNGRMPISIIIIVNTIIQGSVVCGVAWQVIYDVIITVLLLFFFEMIRCPGMGVLN